jgi:Holliday junction resolvasome RuvABC endonuclease subunit
VGHLMNVLGIDPSLTMTGVASIVDGITTAGRIQTEPAKGLADVDARIRYIVARTLRFAPDRCLTVIERPYVPQGQGAAGQLVERAWLFGMLVDQLLLRGPVIEVRPTLRAKYAAGNGHAKKAAVLTAIREAFPNLRVRDDNEADALALAAMGARHLGEPIDGPGSKKQLEVMAAVAWPIPNERKN